MEAFASRDFRRFQLARGVAVLATEAQAVAVAWQVYSITHRALDLGYTGLALFLPGLFFLLPAGHVADRYDRRMVVLVCYSLQLLATAALLWLSWRGVTSVYPIYAILFVIGTGRAFAGPATTALVPHLVPEEHLMNAITWTGVAWQLANITGPALGGILFTLPLARLLPPTARLEGAGVVYLFALVLLGWYLAMIASLDVRPGRMEHRAASLKVVMAGFQYVRHAPVLLGAFSLDLFVVLLGGAVALMPIFAHDILHQGPRGLGLLRAAPAVGAIAMSLLLTRFPLQRHAGRMMFICVSIFGAATALFGISRSLWLSLFLLAVAGAADTISVIVRASVLQMATPMEMRGRISAVNSLFIGASNELGQFESGLTAQWWGAVPATIIGGVASLAIAALWAVFFPSLRKIDELTAEALHPLQEEARRRVAKTMAEE
jgi:MFS family permease